MNMCGRERTLNVEGIGAVKGNLARQFHPAACLPRQWQGKNCGDLPGWAL